MPSRTRLFAAAGALTCTALLAIAVPAHARSEPIALQCTGTFTQPTVISTQPLIGVTTDSLVCSGTPGPFTGTYPHIVNFDDATFAGIAVFTATRGDKLVVSLGGSATPITATTYAITYDGTIAGGTGRYNNATGTLGGPGTVDLANLTVQATLEGTISLNP